MDMISKVNAKYLKGSLVVFFMIFIFYMSNKPAVESNELSYWVINVLETLKIDVNSFFGSFANFVVRKTAHFSEYFILAMLLYIFFREELNILKSTYFSILVSFFYACSDEFHQYFIPGRSMLFKDVLIDTSGAITAMAVIWIIKRIKNEKIIM